MIYGEQSVSGCKQPALGPTETSESHIWKRVGEKGAVERSLRVLPLGLKCDSSGVESPGGY